MENPIKMDDFGVPLFSETPIYITPQKPCRHDKAKFFRKDMSLVGHASFFLVWIVLEVVYEDKIW